MKKNDIKKSFDELYQKYLFALKELDRAQLILEKSPKEVIREVVVPISSQHEKQLIDRIKYLEAELEKKPKEIVVEGPRRPVAVEKAASGDLREAARLLTKSDFNKEDMSEQDIFDMLTKLSEEEVNTTLGFWAVPLPTQDTNTDTKPRYSRKK